MSDLILKLTDQNYDEEISNKEQPIVVDFYADWCGPCQSLGPIFEAAASTYEGKIRFAKINIDEERKLALANSVMSIPTLLFFKDGAQVDRVTGSLNREQLNAQLEKLL